LSSYRSAQQEYFSSCLKSLNTATIDISLIYGALNIYPSYIPFSLGVVSIYTKGLFLPLFLYLL